MDKKWLQEQMRAQHELGRTQVELAEFMGISPTVLNKLINKSRKISATEADQIRQWLANAPGQLAFAEMGRRYTPEGGGQTPVRRKGPPLEVYSSAQGGTEGAMILSSDPVFWIPRDSRLEGIQGAYGCLVSGDSMAPAYEKDNLLLVKPGVAVNSGDDCIFLRETIDGTRYALVKRLVRYNDETWTVLQHNPSKTYGLPRKEWQKAHLVIGKYNRSS